MFDREFETIPSILEDLQPGPELGGILACIEVEDLSGEDRIRVLRAHQRMRSYHDAEVYRGMAAIVDVMDDEDPRWAEEAAEIRAALNGPAASASPTPPPAYLPSSRATGSPHPNGAERTVD